MPREGIQILLNIIYSIIFQLTILWAFVLYFNNSIAVKTAFNLQKPDTSAPQAGLPTSVGLLKLFSVIFILTTSAFLAVNLIDNYINRSFGDILKQTAAYLTMFILAATNLGFIILLKELKSKSSRYAIFFWLFVLLISTFLFYLPAAIAHNIYSLLSNLPLISNLYGLMIIALWWYFANDPEAKTWFNTDYDLQSNQWNIRIVRKVIEKMHSGVLPGFVLIFFIWYSQYLLFTMRFFFYLIIRGEILDPQPETLFYSYLFILNTVLSVLVWIISIFAAWKQKKYTPLLCMVLLILLAATRITPNLSLSTFDQYDIENLLTITAWFIYFLSSKKVKHVFYQREIPTDLINKNKAELPILCFRIFCLYTFAWSFVSCIIQYIFDGHFIIISAITVLVWSILPLINLYLSYKAKNVKTVYIWIFIWIVSLTLSITQIAPSGSYLYLYSQIKDLNYNGLFPAIVAFCYFYSSKKAKEYYLKLNK
ncbi:hypothetical protein [Desulfovibrio litoralis]|nr:hypothetical protein [Desulfovibrio litoralis]